MPLFQLPQLISQLVNAQVALTRLREFLAAAEQHTMAENPPSGPGTASVTALLTAVAVVFWHDRYSCRGYCHG